MSAGAETLKARATYEVRAWLALVALLVALFAAIAVTRITTEPTAITRPNAVVSVDSVGQATRTTSTGALPVRTPRSRTSGRCEVRCS